MKRIGVGTFKTTEKVRDLISAVLDSNRLSYGPYSRELEKRFAEIHQCKFAVLSNSGTSSLQVALQALKELRGWEDGDEVLIPAVTFVATANIVLWNRMVPVPVDVDLTYYEMSPRHLFMKHEKYITKRTRAMIPVHLFGHPCDMSYLKPIAKEYNLEIIEDSCESMFVDCSGKMVGSWGSVGCFSTYVAHLLTTGVGGIATTNDPELAVKMRSLINHGRDGIYISKDDDKGLSDKELKEVISRRFNFTDIGHSFRITELEAAIGLAQLDDYEDMLGQRRKNAETLTVNLKGLSNKLNLPRKRFDAQHAWMMYPIMVFGDEKKELTEFLELNEIETRDMLPLINQPCYEGMWDPDDYPNAQKVDKCGFYVGCHQGLTKGDMLRVANTIRRFYIER